MTDFAKRSRSMVYQSDKHLAAFADQVQSLAGLNPQRLRDLASDRNATRMTADNILAKMQAYMPEGGTQ